MLRVQERFRRLFLKIGWLISIDVGVRIFSSGTNTIKSNNEKMNAKFIDAALLQFKRKLITKLKWK